MRTITMLRMSLVLLLGACGVDGASDEPGAAGGPAVSSQAAAVVVTCPDPKSCAGWSTWTNEGGPTCNTSQPGCGTEVCHPCHCNQDDCQTCCNVLPGKGTTQLQQSFRQCTLQNHTQCRETREQTIFVGCGC